MSKEYKVEGKESTRRKLINKLKESTSLFERLQKVAITSELEKTFGNSINNINASISIIEHLKLDEIAVLIKNMKKNIKNDKG